MRPAWRGVVVNGVVWAWPTVLLDHREAFHKVGFLKGYSCRWRQWHEGGEVDFDPNASAKDKALVIQWVKDASSAR